MSATFYGDKAPCYRYMFCGTREGFRFFILKINHGFWSVVFCF